MRANASQFTTQLDETLALATDEEDVDSLAVKQALRLAVSAALCSSVRQSLFSSTQLLSRTRSSLPRHRNDQARPVEAIQSESEEHATKQGAIQ